MGCSRRRLGCAASLRADVSASRFGEDCPRAHSIGPRLRDPFYSAVGPDADTQTVQTRKQNFATDSACYICGNPLQPKLFLPTSTDESVLPRRALRAESRLHQEGLAHASMLDMCVQERCSKLDSRNTRSLHSAVGNFLSLLGIPQYADQFIDLGLDSLISLSRLSDEGLVKETERIPFLPGHRARLLRGVLVLREVSLMRVREQASKTREKALFDCLAERNQDLAQEVCQLDLKVKTLQAQNTDYEQQLNRFRSQAAEMEVTAKTQAEQLRSLTERLEQCTRPNSAEASAVTVEAWKSECSWTEQRQKSGQSEPRSGMKCRDFNTAGLTESLQMWIKAHIEKENKDSQSESAQPSTSFPSTFSFGSGQLNSNPPTSLQGTRPISAQGVQLTCEEIASSCASVISTRMMPDTGQSKDKDLWAPGCESGPSPGRFELAEFLMDTWNDIGSETAVRSESFPRSFLPVAVLLVVYLDRLSRSPRPLHVTMRNWQRLLFTLIRRAAKEHLHLSADCLGVYSKEEAQLFDDVVSHCDFRVSREDAVAALDLLGFPSIQVEDLHLTPIDF